MVMGRLEPDCWSFIHANLPKMLQMSVVKDCARWDEKFAPCSQTPCQALCKGGEKGYETAPSRFIYHDCLIDFHYPDSSVMSHGSWMNGIHFSPDSTRLQCSFKPDIVTYSGRLL